MREAFSWSRGIGVVAADVSIGDGGWDAECII